MEHYLHSVRPVATDFTMHIYTFHQNLTSGFSYQNILDKLFIVLTLSVLVFI